MNQVIATTDILFSPDDEGGWFSQPILAYIVSPSQEKNEIGFWNYAILSCSGHEISNEDIIQRGNWYYTMGACDRYRTLEQAIEAMTPQAPSYETGAEFWDGSNPNFPQCVGR